MTPKSEQLHSASRTRNVSKNVEENCGRHGNGNDLSNTERSRIRVVSLAERRGGHRRLSTGDTRHRCSSFLFFIPFFLLKKIPLCDFSINFFSHLGRRAEDIWKGGEFNTFFFCFFGRSRRCGGGSFSFKMANQNDYWNQHWWLRNDWILELYFSFGKSCVFAAFLGDFSIKLWVGRWFRKLRLMMIIIFLLLLFRFD